MIKYDNIPYYSLDFLEKTDDDTFGIKSESLNRNAIWQMSNPTR